MFGDYGYMEEGKLGKPYNLKLLKRLGHYGVPYKKTILTALFLTIMITLFDLAVPYFSKIAIDRYILSSWNRLDLRALEHDVVRELTNKYGRLFLKGRDGSFFVSHVDAKNIDPVDLHRLRSQGVLLPRKYYRIEPGRPESTPGRPRNAEFVSLPDGSILVPYDLLYNMPREDVLKVRAGDVRGVALVALVFFLSLFLSFGLNYLQYYLLEFTGQHMMQDIRLQLFERIQSQALRFFDRHPVGRLVTRVTNDIENLNEMFKSVLITVFKDFFLLIGILVVLLYLNWRMALVSFLFLPFVFGLTYLFSAMAREVFRELRGTVAKINAFLQERFSGMRVIQLFARETFHLKTFIRINHENYLAGMKQVRVFAVFMPVMELLSSAAVALIIWYGGGEFIEEQLTLGSLVAFIGYIQMFFKPIRDISEKYNIMQSAMASMERIFEFMDHREEIPEPAQPSAPSQVKGHMVFNRVSFAYQKDRPVLRNVSFEVKPGETVAIVGATGSGKTTVVNLLKRFYDPDEGAVFLDDVDLRRWPKSKLRRSMGSCMQDVFIFAGDLGDNISLGRPEADRDAVESAARHANALPFIRSLPDGFEEKLGEGGSTLSAGQRQLLSFARALAADPRILILDEATSSVDPETERLIQEAISRIAENRTTLVVAHRLSTIRNADRILVMHHGKIVETGTHGELMDAQGIYYRLNRLRGS